MKDVIYHKHGPSNRYRMDAKDIYSNEPLGCLAEFLIQDLGDDSSINFLNKWLIEREHLEFAGTNFPMYQILLEMGIVEIGPVVRGDDREAIWDAQSKDHFKIPIEKMIAILKQYKEVIAIRPYPNKIVFIQDDSGEVTIKPAD